MRAISSTRRSFLRSASNQFGGALGGPLKKESLFLFGNYEGFRQALALSSVSVVPDAQARQGRSRTPSGVYATGRESQSGDAALFLVLAARPNGAELLANGVAERHRVFLQQSQRIHPRGFRHAPRRLRPRERDSLSAAYTIDDGNSLIPLADPLFASYTALRMQVASLRRRTSFRRRC
jgi:hypothetical protein